VADSTGVPDSPSNTWSTANPTVGKNQAASGHFPHALAFCASTRKGNPEQKPSTLIGAESGFTVENFGRPKPGGIKDRSPTTSILNGSTGCVARAALRVAESPPTGRF